MRKIIVYRSSLLPLSETFIQQQFLALRNWKAVLVGERILKRGLDTSSMEVEILGNIQGRLARVAHRLCRKWWVPYLPAAKKLKNVGAELIHVHFGTDAVDIWPSVRAAGLPMLVTLHGYDINTYRDWWESGQGGASRRSYPRRLLKMASDPHVRFVAVSKAIRASAIAFGIPADKIDVAYIGVDTRTFQPAPLPISSRPERILFVGRLVEKKGVEYLIRAFSALRNLHPEAELVIAGDGPLRDQLHMLAITLGVHAKFLGAVSSDQVRELMASSRIFCLPSVTAASGDAEGLPIVILEALASGLGVVTSARGAVGEAVIHDSTGLCFEQGDVEALWACLDIYLRDSQLLNEAGKSARELTTSKFEIMSCSSHLEKLYDQAAGIRGAAASASSPALR